MSTDIEIKRDEKGFPLLPDGKIDWELTSKEKSEWLDKYEASIRGGKKKKPHRKYPSNYTPPKRRR